MKKALTTALALALALTASAQTLNVKTGQVTYAHRAANAGDMTFTGGTTLTVEGRAYNTGEISSITVDDSSVSDNTVSVSYGGTSASVVVSGNIARHLTVAVSGAHVTVTQSADLQQEVSYTLSGSSTNGSFTMNGDYKAAFVLSNLTLINLSGPAIDIEDGKAIAVTLSGTNTLSDATGGTHNATLYIDGHPTFSGTGSLTLRGLTKHAFSSGEYVVVAGGTINVSQAASDGFHINERFQMDGGQLTISAAGDGIDVGFRGANKGTKDQYERNGFMELNGGILSVTSSGASTKALKADSTITIAGATVSATTTGTATYDATAKDFSSCAAMKTGGQFVLSSGTLTALSTGAGGKGINATGNIQITGGTAYVTTTGSLFEYGNDDTKPQGIKSDANITVSGGAVYVCAGTYDGKATAFKPGDTSAFTINGGTLMGIARKKSTVSTASKQASTYATGQKITGGQTVTLSGVSYTVPTGYSNTSANVVVSK